MIGAQRAVLSGLPGPFVLRMTVGGGGVLGWVLNRDAQHRPLTRNATKGQKGGSKLYIF